MTSLRPGIVVISLLPLRAREKVYGQEDKIATQAHGNVSPYSPGQRVY